MKKSEKRLALEAMLNAQDLGLKGVEKSLESFDNETELPQDDPLTKFLFYTINCEDDLDGVQTTLDYAINQLKMAKGAIVNLQKIIQNGLN